MLVEFFEIKIYGHFFLFIGWTGLYVAVNLVLYPDDDCVIFLFINKFKIYRTKLIYIPQQKSTNISHLDT